MATPEDRRYTKEHEWVLVGADNTARVGITDYAQNQLGDVVFLDLPQPGTQVAHLKKLGEVESVKAVSDLFSPVSGEVIEANAEAVDRPELVNEDPYGKGWLLRVKLSTPGELDSLLTAQEYEAFLSELK